jgi:hypothetical protein
MVILWTSTSRESRVPFIEASPAMKCVAGLAMILLAGLFALATPQTCVGQGGHGGGGGHGFGSHGGGHSSHGLSAGNTSGHQARGRSIGRSVAHFFGWRRTSASSQPPATRPASSNPKTVPPSNPSIVLPPRTHPRPRWPGEEIIFGPPFMFRHRRFGFVGCSPFGFPPNSFFWSTELDCFNSGFFFDPFFFAGFSSYDFPTSGSSFIGWTEVPFAASQERSGSVEVSSTDAENAAESTVKRELPVTSLVLQDGSEFGLTEYWLEGYDLHYVTTYGGRNSLPVQRIDLEKTVELNAERGVKFVLRPRPAEPRSLKD